MKPVFGILNGYDHRNRGDRAIIEAQMAWLRRKSPDARFRVFSAAWEENSSVFGQEVSVPPLIRRDSGRSAVANIFVPFFRSIQAAYGYTPARGEYESIDAFFLCGGGYFYSSTAPVVSRQLWLHAGNSLAALNTGKPVMQFPQSWGPFTKTADEWIIRRLCDHLPCLCSRGKESTALLKVWGHERKTIEVPDIVLALGKLRPDLVRTEFSPEGDLGIAPIDFGFAINRTQEDLYRYLDGLAVIGLNHVRSGGRGVVLFPQVEVTGSDEDFTVAEELARRLHVANVSCRILNNLPWERYFEEVSKVSVFLGSRMHACIFAMISGVPTVGLSYQPKFQALFSQMGISERCHSIMEFDPDTVAKQLSKLAGMEGERLAILDKVGAISAKVLAGLDLCWQRSGFPVYD